MGVIDLGILFAAIGFALLGVIWLTLRSLSKIGYDGVEVDCVHILDTRLWTISKEQRSLLKRAIADLGIEVEER